MDMVHSDLYNNARIAIMGAGAIGSVVGGMLAKNGHRVTLIGRRPHMEEISKNGLCISGIWGEHRVSQLRTRTSPPDEHQDIIFLTVKAFDTATAARQALSMVGPDSIIISMQNGLDNVETLASIAGRDRTLGAMAIFGVVMSAPGRVQVTSIASETLIGEIDGGESPRSEALAHMMDKAGIPTKASNNIMQQIWHKALFNIALNPLSAIFQATYGQVADDPHLKLFIREMVSEAFRAAGALGMDLGMDSPDEYLEVLWRDKVPPTRKHRSSMLQDIIHGKKTEIDYINGKIVEIGKRYGIEMPYNRGIVLMVKAKEKLTGRISL
ncbi:MAG: 2-dehydropantoate 2-reductase [Nitrospiraceae bacterium]|nr:2-dehydropantoate 2-reductase [Nitrospiraceae bacterium]